MGSMKRTVMLACSNVMVKDYRWYPVHFHFRSLRIQALTPRIEPRATDIRSIGRTPQIGHPQRRADPLLGPTTQLYNAQATL